MKELFISVYDSALGSLAILDSDKGSELKYIKDPYETRKLLNAILVDGDPSWIIEKDLKKDSPEIQEFDRIFVCENGGLDLYTKGRDY